jgi:hypothetical protein
MAPVPVWLELIAWSKAAFDVLKLGVDGATAFRQYLDDPHTRSQARDASLTYSTYSPGEVSALTERIKHCTERFEREGMQPPMARLTLARKIAAIALKIWKKGERFDPAKLKQQAA